MDKFMIDKYVETIPNPVPVPINQLIDNPVPIKPFELIENHDTSEESIFSPFRFISIFGLLLFVGFGLYYAVKYNYNENHYLIKKNAKNFDITLDELKTDIKNVIKQKYEDFIDWKEQMRTNTNKYIFNKHLENGAFKTTKYKATNLLSMFMPVKNEKVPF